MTVRYDNSTAKAWAEAQSKEAGGERDAAAADEAIRSLRERAAKGELPVFSPESSAESLEQIREVAEHLRSRFSQCLVLGMGGATLNPQSVVASVRGRAGMEVLFLDHVDYDSAEALLDKLDPEECCFLIISKSGATLETMAQFCFFWTYLQEQGVMQLSERFVFITEPGDNPLRNAARDLKALTLDHPKNVGGRFAAFTAVGLLPGALAGADVDAFMKGGKAALSDGLFGDRSPAKDSALMFAEMIRCGVRAHIIMSYVRRAAPLTRWYCQIWSESLGKNDFPVIPVAAQGTLDQHSQLQLYLGGKNDKVFTMVQAGRPEGSAPFLAPPAVAASAPWLDGKDLSAVNGASFRATCETLKRGKRPLRTALFNRADAFAFGEFMMYSMLEVVILAGIKGINPFDQPHVEEGKRLTRLALAGRAAS